MNEPKPKKGNIKDNPIYNSLSPLEKRIMQFILNNRTSMNDYDIADQLHLPRDKVKKALEKLVELKLLV